MNIEQVKYFLEVEKYKSFTLASEELCISQSSLSKQIKSLEKELNTELFIRNPRNILLSYSGEKFLEYAKSYVTLHNKILKEMMDISNRELNIGITPLLSQYGIISLINTFNKSFSKINLNLIENDSSNLFKLFNSKSINLAFTNLNDIDTENYNAISLFKDELVLVISKNNPLAKVESINICSLSKETFILSESNNSLYNLCTKECLKSGFYPKISYSSCRIDTILELVSQGFGVTLLPQKVINKFNTENLRSIPLQNTIINEIVLTFPKNLPLSTETKLFIEFIISKK
ncbi:LysR family transcriptional regulator [Clostridium septicum]|uniref:LysR family transcriptional regulator n=1 Tax=Clostridium septicum TaxID=1504 RepID=UPI0008344AA1|nr:LysR family transcriptional regulator [Clostridium septicum]MDU1312678.1 LysR family transcriptional regulator [Clostridium septicum]